MQYQETSSDEAGWEHLSPMLDEAMNELKPPDRDALLLRYFKNLDLRAVGAALGVSDDTAQKRVARALEKLRELLARRGVAASAVALSVILATNAVQAAPAGLVPFISSAAASAGTTAQTATLVTTAKAVAMSATQKAVIGTILAAAVGTGVYEARQASRLGDQVRVLQQEQASLNEQVAGLWEERQKLTNQVAFLKSEGKPPQTDPGEAVQLADQPKRNPAGGAPGVPDELRWKENRAKLQGFFRERSNQRIPELALLNESIWLDASKNADLESEEGIRKAMSGLRYRAESLFVIGLQKAVEQFSENHDGRFPADASQLAPYLIPPADRSWLRRYAVVPEESVSANLGSESVLVQKEPVDSEHDWQWIVGEHGYTMRRFGVDPAEAAVRTLEPALRAFRSANAGKTPTTFAEIEPYLKTAEEKAAFQTVKDAAVKIPAPPRTR